MAEEHPPLDARVTAVERTLTAIESRLRAIEHERPMTEAVADRGAGHGGAVLPRVDVAGTAALVGRAFVLFAGAYLLRALTDWHLLNPAAGAVLGLAYALALMAVAYRTAPHHDAGASFFGGCAVIVSFPLLWEITTRFELLTPPMAALVLTVTVALILAVAWHRRLHALAWIATVGACLLGGALQVATGHPIPFTAFLIGLGIATLWLGYDREWTGLRWVVALFADLAVLRLIARGLTDPPLETPGPVMGILMLLLVTYLGSIAIRTLVRRRDLVPFEAAQTAVLLTVGLTGAVLIAQRTGTGAVVLGPTLLLLAIASYAVALVHREWHTSTTNYYFYTTLAIIFMLAGGKFMFDGTLAGVLWTLLALGTSWLARRFRRSTLHVHAIVYLVLGAWTTGLAAAVTSTLLGSAATSTVAPLSSWFAAVAVVLCWWMARSPEPQSTRVPRTTLLLLLVVTVAGAAVAVVQVILDPAVDAALRPGLVATTRTAAFAAGAVLLAWLGSRPATPEFGWLVYPLLGWGFLKLLVEDFRVSPPSLLFVALGLYGAALIAVPRVARPKPAG